MADKNLLGFAIQFYFDAQTESAVLSFRDSLYRSGIEPELGKLNDRPHVTLTVVSHADQHVLIRTTEEFASQLDPFPVQLAGNGVFPTADNVLFLIPVPSLHLIKTHRNFHRILKKKGIVSVYYYLPDQWVPHCTLESEQPDEQFELMLQRCKQNFNPIQGYFASIGVISFHPICYLAEFPLQVKER